MKPMPETPPRAKKSLGQNFLQDANIARKIVRTLEISQEDQVLEIGPGPGALTGHVQNAGPKRLVLVEKDGYWAATRLREGRARGEEWREGRLSVILADALTMPWERFSSPWKFIGNLPYNVASPLMWEIFSRAPGLTRAVFMVQKEVGQRIVAKPSTGAYGALSVWIQSFVSPKLEFIVPPQVFRPQPKVDSAVLSFTSLGEAAERGGVLGGGTPSGDPCIKETGQGNFSEGGSFPAQALANTLHFCFQRRRKQLGGIVRAAGGTLESLDALGIDVRLRPEALTVKEFHKLAISGIFLRK